MSKIKRSSSPIRRRSVLPPESRESPYAFFAKLRRECPVYQPSGTDRYVLTRHEDLTWAASRPELFSVVDPDMDYGHMSSHRTQRYETMPTLNRVDPPVHTPLRRLVASLFTPRRISAYEPMIQREVDELIDRFADRHEVEFGAAFASILPTRVIGAILGLPRELSPQLKTWADELLVFIQGGLAPAEEESHARSAAAFLNFNATYFQAQARYLFPSLGLLSLGLAGGWLEWSRRREWLATGVISAGMLVLATYALFGVLVPAFH